MPTWRWPRIIATIEPTCTATLVRPSSARTTLIRLPCGTTSATPLTVVRLGQHELRLLLRFWIGDHVQHNVAVRGQIWIGEITHCVSKETPSSLREQARPSSTSNPGGVSWLLEKGRELAGKQTLSVPDAWICSSERADAAGASAVDKNRAAMAKRHAARSLLSSASEREYRR